MEPPNSILEQLRQTHAGELHLAVGIDPQAQLVCIVFPQALSHLAISAEYAETLGNLLIEKSKQLSRQP